MRATTYAPTHEFRSTCPYCGKQVWLLVNLKSDTTDSAQSGMCPHTDGSSSSPSGKFITFQDQGRLYPTKAAYIYQRAEVTRL
jgi:hypothetical protein